MLTVIKRLLQGLFGRPRSQPPEPPRDPYAYRSAPRKRGPSDRSAAVAVAEPDED